MYRNIRFRDNVMKSSKMKRGCFATYGFSYGICWTFLIALKLELVCLCNEWLTNCLLQFLFKIRIYIQSVEQRKYIICVFQRPRNSAVVFSFLLWNWDFNYFLFSVMEIQHPYQINVQQWSFCERFLKTKHIQLW